MLAWCRGWTNYVVPLTETSWVATETGNQSSPWTALTRRQEPGEDSLGYTPFASPIGIAVSLWMPTWDVCGTRPGH